MREEAERAEPVRHAHEDDTLLRELRAVVQRDARLSAEESAAVNQTITGSCVAGGFRRRPHVEVQAVFAHLRRPAEEAREHRVLHARRPELRGVLDARPRLHGLRRLPSQRADGRRRERDALERDDTVGGDTGHSAAGHVRFADLGARIQRQEESRERREERGCLHTGTSRGIVLA
jgi:hypothetical protein